MFEKLKEATGAYHKNWSQLVAQRSNKAFFEGLRPVAVGWKVADRSEYERLYAELHDECDRIVETWMNGRWIAKMHLKDSTLPNGIEIIKLMQRRPGSSDATGLDHVDFYSHEVAKAEEILKGESDLKWTRESNDVVDNYEWISIWFDGTEAKLKAYTVMDIVARELQEINTRIIDAAQA